MIGKFGVVFQLMTKVEFAVIVIAIIKKGRSNF